jgi:hypothetical protein
LQLAGGQGVTLQDAQYVHTQLVAMANASVHGAFNPKMTTNPHFVSKAIFDWWWHYRGNKQRIPPYSKPRNPSAGTLSTLRKQSHQVVAGLNLFSSCACAHAYHAHRMKERKGGRQDSNQKAAH